LYDAVVAALDAIGVTTSKMAVITGGDQATASCRELQILLAEDNVVNQKLALGILGSLGHHVTVANNGREALEKIEKRKFDIVLMDVQMPEMDGLTATRELRRREAQIRTQAHLPVVAMTAHAMKGDREYCLASGMDDYLCKPIRLKDMAEKLAEMFPAEASDGPEVELADVETDSGDVVAWQEALANVNGDTKLLCAVIEEFLDDTPGLLMKAVEAANREDAEALRAAAHSVKGSMLFLNPKDALECAWQVEVLAANGNIDASSAALDDLHVLFGAVCQSLESYLVSHKD
jgi:CheY-like chemotaxis protein/HPt (histidine-containing phosphotransfer) domain-containing protein